MGDLTGALAVLGSILSVVSVLYGIAQALQKADKNYVASLQARIIEDGNRISALEDSLRDSGIDREKLTRDLLGVTSLLMEAQRQLAETTRTVRADIAETTGVAKQAVQQAEAAYHEANTVNEKIAAVHQEIKGALERVSGEPLAQQGTEKAADKLDDAVPPRER
jgi:hypothetical protein